MSKFPEVSEKIAETITNGYQRIEDAVVSSYQKMEKGILVSFGKFTDKCVEVLFAKDGEAVEDAKKRLSGDDK